MLVVAVAGNFMLGALMSLGIGLYAPCMVLISLLGMAILLNVSQHASPSHVVTVSMAKPDA